jgi:hypothetical protein
VNPQLLGPGQLARLDTAPADLVLVEPDLTTLNVLAPGVLPVGEDGASTLEPGSADADAVAAGSVTGGGLHYRIDPSAPGSASADAASGGAVGCYPRPDAADEYAFVRLETGRHRVTVLGGRQILQNGELAREGNAALALRTLGAGSAVRWYLPDPLELGVDQAPSASDLLPGWVRWVFWQLVIATVVALVWRARRLGRVVTEPLPVVVRSAETVEGRARLYRVSKARDRAAAILRTAALRRIAARLGVPVTAPPDEVARLAAVAVGRPEADVRAVLLGAAPRDDAGLVTLAAGLDAVEDALAAAGSGPAGSITAGPDGYGGRRQSEGGGTRP